MYLRVGPASDLAGLMRDFLTLRELADLLSIGSMGWPQLFHSRFRRGRGSGEGSSWTLRIRAGQP
jgi:hypothetical protein